MVNAPKAITMGPDTLPDGRVKSRVANYNAFWDKDAAHDGDEHKANRVENYKDVINGMRSLHALKDIELTDNAGYYDGATELYEYGWAQSFHFSRFYKGEPFLQSVGTLLSVTDCPITDP